DFRPTRGETQVSVRRVPSCFAVPLFGAIAASVATAQHDGAGGPFGVAIDAARERVVKIYGGGFGRERGYGSGVIVSADGRIVTTLSVLLESPALRAVLPDGGRFPAQVIKRDEVRQLALLQIEADNLPFFEPAGSGHLRPGDWVIAAANPFKVADGPEPVSVAVGVFSGYGELFARRRAQDFVYEGPVLITDIIVTTPGSAGGALVDAEGRLVGVIGKAVISKRTNTWANYALPVEQVAAFLSDTTATRAADLAAGNEASSSRRRPDLGIRLFDVGGRARPAYVERVRRGSPAWQVGIRPNDLILSLGGELISTCEDFYKARAGLRVGEPTAVVIKRGNELKTVELTVRGREQ
ncbi:MAG: S1C family serine protease, partial [Phycisphaerae bacterium]